MIDLDLAHLALRNRALSLTAYTTGSISLEATTTGYVRGSGSFLTDGFRLGMEVTVSGFAIAANNGTGVITHVEALVMLVSMFVATVTNGVASVTRPATVVEPADVGRTISVRAPSLRAWENTNFKPAATIPYLDEDFVPTSHQVFSFPAQGGEAVEEGEYFLKWYGVPNVGAHALRKSVDGLKALFTPGTRVTAGAHVVRVREGVGPQAGQIIPLDGWAVLILRVPWRAYSTNVIAA